MGLLAVFAAVKIINNLLCVFENFRVRRVYVVCDAQVVLSWCLSSVVKTKTIFAANRIKDVKKMVNKIREKYSLNVEFKYVPTGDNPADLLSRGLSFENFKLKLDTWVHGPHWIRALEVQWPLSDFCCLSPSSKNFILTTTLSSSDPVLPIVPFERYSRLAKLINVTKFWTMFYGWLGCLKEEEMERIWG